MRLWDWALAAYARPGVAGACQSLQDDHGQNVPLLLAAAWAAAEGRAFDPDRASSLTAVWDDRAVTALRAARRGLKAQMSGIDDAGREALRSAVKAAELSAERLLLEGLENLAGPTGAMETPRATVVERTAQAFAAHRGVEAPPHAAVAQLCALF